MWETPALHPDRLLARLDDHHRGIGHDLAEGQRLLIDADTCRLKALCLVRWQLIRRLRAFQLFKHTHLFDPLIAAGPPMRRLQATELKRRCLAMGDLYAVHVRRWTLSAAADDWPAYRRDADAMARRIRRHLADEAGGIRLLLRAVPPFADKPAFGTRQPTRGLSVAAARPRPAVPSAARDPALT